MNKVYVLQDTGKHDYAKAEQYGQLVFCSGSRDINTAFQLTATPNNIEVMAGILHNLRHFRPEDMLVISGNPIIIAIAVHHLLTMQPSVSVLKWDGYANGYNQVRISNADIETFLNS